MKKIFIFLLSILCAQGTIIAQVRVDAQSKMAVGHTSPVEKLDVNGAVKIGNTTNSNAGTIRYTGSDFEGYLNGLWYSLTSIDLSGIRDTLGVLEDSTQNQATRLDNLENDIQNISPSPWSQISSDIHYNGGKVGIGNNTPTGRLDITTNTYNFPGGYADNLKLTHSLYPAIFFDRTSSNTGFLMAVDGNGYNFNSTVGNTPTIRFVIKSSGELGVGTASPTEKLDIDGNARFRSVGSSPSLGALHYTTNGTLTTNTSDVHFKERITKIKSPLKKIQRLRGVKYNWKQDKKAGRQIGLIAQEVEKVIPELVFTNPVDNYKGVHYDKAVAVLIEAIKEQQTQIESLQKQISQIKKNQK